MAGPSEVSVRAYEDAFITVAQLKESQLAKAVKQDQVVGKMKQYPRLSNATDTMGVISSRHAATVYGEPDYSRRTLFLSHRQFAQRLMDQDKVEMLADPSNIYTQYLAETYARTKEDILIEAALGNSNEGENGTTTTALPAGQQIAAGGTGLTLAKVKEAYSKFLANYVNLAGKTLYLFTSAAGFLDLQTDSGLTSKDFVPGMVNVHPTDLMSFNVSGFNVMVAQRLVNYTGASASSSSRPAIAIANSALVYGQSLYKVRVGELPDYNWETAFYISASMGAVRLMDEEVVDIRYVE